jgi:formylglycine-generating enzyme required for sulfatase activity
MKLAIALATFCCSWAVCAAAERLAVGPADLVSVLPSGTAAASVHVDRFYMDRRPVTNAEFLAFVNAQPRWRRDRVPGLLADGDYLSQWAQADRLGVSIQPDQPVTRVSWFAARSYCEAAGARLPDWYEWELASAADERQADARSNAQWRARILDWYAQPATHPLARVGSGLPNYYGIQDLHGLVWEWVDDFSALMVSGDSRDQGDPDKLKFCGAGALSLKDRENYAVLMRVAFLSSLEARSTAHSLGFRCVSRVPG